MNDEKLMNTNQAAERLGCAASTLTKMRLRGDSGLPFVKIGAAVRYRRSDLDAFIAARVRRSTSDDAAGARSNAGARQ